MQGTVTGIGIRAVRHLDMDKALSADGDIGRGAGFVQRTLSMNTGGRHRTHTGTQLQTGRQRGLLGAHRTRLADVLIKQIFKHRTLAFKTVGADVGQVVGNNIQVRLLGFKPGFGNP